MADVRNILVLPVLNSLVKSALSTRDFGFEEQRKVHSGIDILGLLELEREDDFKTDGNM